MRYGRYLTLFLSILAITPAWAEGGTVPQEKIAPATAEAASPSKENIPSPTAAAPSVAEPVKAETTVAAPMVTEDVTPTVAEGATPLSTAEGAAPAENATPPAEAVLTSAESEVDYNVFSPQFMADLRQCRPASESGHTQYGEPAEITIVGPTADRCHLQYADFDLLMPDDLLGSIHGFDDLPPLLRNADIAHYKFKPEYVYDGLLYALTACAQKSDYFGTQDVAEKGYVRTTKGLSAEYFNHLCHVYLTSELDIDGIVNDYTVVCQVPDSALESIVENYADVLEKYGEKRQGIAEGRATGRAAVQNAATQKADTELMFYLQQSGYCQRPQL